MKGETYSGDVLEFGEQTLFLIPGQKQQKLDDRWEGPHTWVGKTDLGDEHIGIASTCEVTYRARSARRLRINAKWDFKALENIKVTPWHPEFRRERTAETAPRRRYITWAIVERLGRTDGCANCAGDGGAHSAACRLRNEELLDKEEAKAAELTERGQVSQ